MRHSRVHDRRPIGAAILVTGVATAVALLGGSALAPATPAEAAVRSAGAADAVPGRYIVVLRGNPALGRLTEAVDRLAARYGATVAQRYEGTFRGFSAGLTALAARRLAANPAVEYVEQDRRIRLSATQRNLPSWGLDRIDQRSRSRNGTYHYSRTAGNVRAYILDTGIRVDHRDFGGRARNGWDFIGRDAVANDCHGHGTHVAGTVGGTRYGVAKNVRLVAVRVLDCEGSGWTSQIIAGVNWVTRHAVRPAVANMSLGGGASPSLDAAVRASIASGVTYAVAGGNNSANACSASPARVATAITVGATSTTDARASFSNYGSCLDIFAPGVNITSAARRSRTATATWSGTSMAAPHVAGAAALVLAAHPRYTARQVRDALVAGATTGRVTNRGSGSPNRLLYSPAVNAPPPPAPAPTPCVWRTDSVDRPLGGGTATGTVNFTGCAGTASASGTVLVHVTGIQRGQVSITLVAPDGTGYPVKEADAADTAPGVHETFPVDASDSTRAGVWKLLVTDEAGAGTGGLDGWTLSL